MAAASDSGAFSTHRPHRFAFRPCQGVPLPAITGTSWATGADDDIRLIRLDNPGHFWRLTVFRANPTIRPPPASMPPP